jgi:putative ATP-dependent endonuclease of OLD family
VQLSSVNVRGFRCLDDLSLAISPHTLLIGENGAGKSTVLHALRWFFEGGQVGPADLHEAVDGSAAVDEISVEVEFSNLDERDRLILGKYGRGPVARFRRSWRPDTGESVIGHSRQGPGFAVVRNAGKVAAMKPAYVALQTAVAGLPDATLKAAMLDALDAWEADPGNAAELEPIDDADASPLFGAVGTGGLRRLVNFILVPAALDLGAEVAGQRKDTVLMSIVGTLAGDAASRARDTWLEANAAIVASFASAIQDAVSVQVTDAGASVSTFLAELVPGAGVNFSASSPEFDVRSAPTLAANFELRGRRGPIEGEGHGVQRAFVMAALQALAAMGADPAERPRLVLALEEPEIYQHPTRARHFGVVLDSLSTSGRATVLAATHSPYLVRPEQFTSLRRIRNRDGIVTVSATTVDDVANEHDLSPEAVERYVQKEVPTDFSECFFADRVVLVEGATDVAVLGALAPRLSTSFESNGIRLQECGGSGDLRKAAALLHELDIDVYVVADGDALGHLRKAADKQDQTRASHEAATERLLTWVPPSETLLGADRPLFGDMAVKRDWALFEDDIEHELEQWPSFVDLMNQAGQRIRGKTVAYHRAAATDASLDDIPDSLRTVVLAALGVAN